MNAMHHTLYSHERRSTNGWQHRQQMYETPIPGRHRSLILYTRVANVLFCATSNRALFSSQSKGTNVIENKKSTFRKERKTMDVVETPLFIRLPLYMSRYGCCFEGQGYLRCCHVP